MKRRSFRQFGEPYRPVDTPLSTPVKPLSTHEKRLDDTAARLAQVRRADDLTPDLVGRAYWTVVDQVNPQGGWVRMKDVAVLLGVQIQDLLRWAFQSGVYRMDLQLRGQTEPESEMRIAADLRGLGAALAGTGIIALAVVLLHVIAGALS